MKYSPSIATIANYLHSIFNDPPALHWLYFKHKDESYYLINAENEEKCNAIITEHVAILKQTQDQVRDEYFSVAPYQHVEIESIRLRTYIDEGHEQRFFLIIKFPDEVVNENLIRECLVFIFDQSIHSYAGVKSALQHAFAIQNTFLLEKRRTKYTLLDRLTTINHIQQGESIRVTVDQIIQVASLPDGKNLQAALPSQLILEFERPVFGWTASAQTQYMQWVDTITSRIEPKNILPKPRSKFCDIDSILL